MRTSILTAQPTPAPQPTRRVTPQTRRSQPYLHDFAGALVLDTGLRNLPLASFAANRIWCVVVALAADITAWMQMLAFTEHEAARRWEPKKLRCRIFTIPATLARTGRRVWLRLSTRSPWAGLTLTGLGRLADLAPG